MSIEVRNQQRRYPADTALIGKLSEAILSLCGFEDSDLSILLVNDRRMRDLNRLHRGIDRSTDVLSFPMIESDRDLSHFKKRLVKFDSPPRLLGDIVLSMERIFSQADEQGHPPDHELLILLIHGILHLIGYDHERSSLEKKRMKRKETLVLSALIAKRQIIQGAA